MYYPTSWRTRMSKCKAVRSRGEWVCTSCNYTWLVGERAPLCRPHYVGDEALKRIKEVLCKTKS